MYGVPVASETRVLLNYFTQRSSGHTDLYSCIPLVPQQFIQPQWRIIIDLHPQYTAPVAPVAAPSVRVPEVPRQPDGVRVDAAEVEGRPEV